MIVGGQGIVNESKDVDANVYVASAPGATAGDQSTATTVNLQMVYLNVALGIIVLSLITHRDGGGDGGSGGSSLLGKFLSVFSTLLGKK